MLFIVKMKNLSVLTTKLFISQAFNHLSCTSFQRALVTTHFLHTHTFKHNQTIKEPDSYPKLNNHSENFGKVVDLGASFDEVKTYEFKKKRRKRKKKIRSLNDVVNFDDSVKSFEMKDVKLTENNEVEKSEISCSDKPKYNIIQDKFKIFSSLMLKIKSRTMREKSQQIILEGKRLIHSAISAGLMPQQIFFSRISDLEKLCLPESVPLYQVPYKMIKLWSDVVTPQGVLGVFDKSKLSTVKNFAKSVPLTVICDNIRDPGNLGCILRIVAGIGCENLLLTKGCVDVWDMKVLRAGAGSHFQLRIINDLQWNDIESEISQSSKILLADLNDDSPFNKTSEGENKLAAETGGFRRRSEIAKTLPISCYYTVNYGTESTVIIIGGETHGISDEGYEFAKKRNGIRVFIPINDKIDSLNSSVTLGILAYEFKRQFDFITKEYHQKTREPNHSENKAS